MILEEDIRERKVLEVAESMMIAARTAPKAKGVDNLTIVTFKKSEINSISERMKEMVEKEGYPGFYLRDSQNILRADALFAIGTAVKSLGIDNCGICGNRSCDEKKLNPDHPCSFNTGDLGIAIGSAVSIASNHRVDSRVMFSVGNTIKKMGLLGEDVKIIYGIPLSVSNKSPFFDRQA